MLRVYNEDYNYSLSVPGKISGAVRRLIPNEGLILEETPNGEVLVIAAWLLTNKKNKPAINDFIAGLSSSLTRKKGRSNLLIAKIQGGENLTKIDSTPSKDYLCTNLDLYINNMSFNGVILIKDNKNKEEIEDILKSSIKKKMEDFLPIPLEEEWEDIFFQKILENKSSFLKELSIVGRNNPYSKAYRLVLDNSFLEKELSLAYGKSQFIRSFKRAPKIEELWLTIDPQSFKFKEWQIFLGEIGGLEGFEEFGDFKEVVVYLFEVFGKNSSKVINALEALNINFINLSFKEASINIFKNKSFQKSSVFDIFIKCLNIIKEYIDREANKGNHIPLLGIINNLVASIGKLNLNRLSKAPKSFVAELQTNSYNPEKGAEGLALTASHMFLSLEHYKDYEKQYLAAMPNIISSSRTYPTVKGTTQAGYSYESADMGTPTAWFVGLATNCCQHLHSVGSSCVEFAAQNPDISGMFIVRDKRNKIIAQSWFWFNQNTRDFVFDNIEVLGEEVRDSIFECYTDFIERELKPRADLFQIKRVCVGLGYNDMEKLKDFSKTIRRTSIKMFSKKTGASDTYSDAEEQVTIAQF